ncbi:putative HTH-type transcriptional regulator YtcD [compost metagenome]
MEYELSAYGQSLRSILDSLCAWGEQHIIREYGDKFAVLEDNVLNQKKPEEESAGAEQLQ